jgi:hypothetical protein
LLSYFLHQGKWRIFSKAALETEVPSFPFELTGSKDAVGGQCTLDPTFFFAGP